MVTEFYSCFGGFLGRAQDLLAPDGAPSSRQGAKSGIPHAQAAPSHRGATTQRKAQTGRCSLPPECTKAPPVRPRRRQQRLILADYSTHLHPHYITTRVEGLFIYSFIDTLTRFTISNQYYLTVLLLVIAWRKLERGSIKCSPPHPPV